MKEFERIVNAAAPQRRVVSLPGEPEGVYGLVGADGEIERTQAQQPPLDHAADDLPTLAAVAKAWTGGAVVAVWYDRSNVQAVATHSGSEPPDTCTVTLEPSAQLQKLAEWRAAGKQFVTQKEFVLLLRTLFHGCWNAHPTLLDTVRKLRVQSASDAASEVQRGKVSLGKSMVAEMSGVGDIPERVTFEVPVFAGPAVRATAEVRMVLDPDAESGQLLVVVLPDEIDRAYAVGEDRAQTMLDGLLEGVEIPVYHGRP